MNRLIKTLCLVLVVFAFFAQDGYAFWGRKRAPKSEPEVE